MKRFFYLVIVASILAFLFSSCKKDETDVNDSGSGIYLGVIGFNDKITIYTSKKGNKNLVRLSSKTQGSFDSFIDSNEIGEGTKLYHAVNVAIDKLAAANLPNDIKNVSIVTFTDGLDLGSYGESSYDSNADYLAAINRRILNETVKGLRINAYTIGVKGNDVNDYNKFYSDLEKLSSDEDNVMVVSSMRQVEDKFKEIAESLYKENISQSLTLTIPLPEKDQRIRFTFDHMSSPEYSGIYIDCQFSTKSDKTLKNISYHGIVGSQTSIVGTSKDSYHISYDFGGICLEDGDVVPTDNVREWYAIDGGGWQVNSEFAGSDNIDISTEQSSAAIMLVLDYSSSLGSDESDMRRAAKDFIDVLMGSDK